MAKRGRTSAAALAIAAPAAIETVQRLKAPHDLTDEETEIWAAVINTQPADHFTPATVPLLTQYCRHSVHARRIAELLEHALSDKKFSLRSYNALLKMQERESRAIAALATKMRLTQQATTNHRGNKKPNAARKPWDLD